MWYGFLFLAAMFISFFSGGLGNVGWFLAATLLFTVSIFVSSMEVRDEPTWEYGIIVALIWLGAMGGLSWPTLRDTLPWIGVAVTIVFALKLDQKIWSWFQKITKK